MENAQDLTQSREGPRPRGAYPAWKRALKPIASLRVTVVLFVLSLALVFYGTLAQKEQDIWDVVHEYFWSWWVMVPNRLNQIFLQTFFQLSPTLPNGMVPGFPCRGASCFSGPFWSIWSPRISSGSASPGPGRASSSSMPAFS